MRFLLDENAEQRIRSFLESEGHDVTSVVTDYPQSLRDDEVLSIANAEQRIVITNDSDFGELVFRQEAPHSGVMLLRLRAGDTAAKIEALRKALRSHEHELNRFIVIDRRGVRVR